MLILPSTAMAQLPQGQPFQEIQEQIDQVNSDLNSFRGYTCPEGQYVTGFTQSGNVICSALPQPPTTQTCTMLFPRCDNPTSCTDPFDSSHADFMISFQSNMIGHTISAIGVEIWQSTLGGAYVEIRDALGPFELLATSERVELSRYGWQEFRFANGYKITGEVLTIHFVTSSSGARIYNAHGNVTFSPSGITAHGLGFDQHMARAYIKIY
jgi:hypothetical protein